MFLFVAVNIILYLTVDFCICYFAVLLPQKLF